MRGKGGGFLQTLAKQVRKLPSVSASVCYVITNISNHAYEKTIFLPERQSSILYTSVFDLVVLVKLKI